MSDRRTVTVSWEDGDSSASVHVEPELSDANALRCLRVAKLSIEAVLASETGEALPDNVNAVEQDVDEADA